jgi:hypothetical protein
MRRLAYLINYIVYIKMDIENLIKEFCILLKTINMRREEFETLVLQML